MIASRTGSLRLGGTRIRYSVEGSGPPLLLFNGIGASYELLEPLRMALPSRTTIAWDAPGAGESGVPLRRPSMGHVADTAAALLDHLAIERADVLGVSWGGLAAQEMALRHPERVRRLVLVATGTGWTSVPGDLRVLPIMLSNRRYISPEYFFKVAPRLYGGDIARMPELHHHAFERLRHAPSTAGYWWQMLATAGWSSWRRLPRIEAPTLVMGGDDDPISHPANARNLARRIPDANLEIVEGGGHLFLITRPRRSAQSISRFLNGAKGR